MKFSRQLLDGSVSVVSLITSEANVDTNLFELTFPYVWFAKVFQQEVPPSPNPMSNIFNAFDIYGWSMISMSLPSFGAALLLALIVEERLQITSVGVTVSCSNTSIYMRIDVKQPDIWPIVLLPYCILFGEHHTKLYKEWSGGIQRLPGIFLRQLANISFFFLVAAFSSTLKAVLVNPGEPKLLQFNDEITTAGKPVVLYYGDRLEYEMLLKSNYEFDKWLYENAEAVFFYNEE